VGAELEPATDEPCRLVRQRRLPDAPRTDHRDQPVSGQPFGQLGKLVIAPDQLHVVLPAEAYEPATTRPHHVVSAKLTPSKT